MAVESISIRMIKIIQAFNKWLYIFIDEIVVLNPVTLADCLVLIDNVGFIQPIPEGFIQVNLTERIPGLRQFYIAAVFAPPSTLSQGAPQRYFAEGKS